jgi:hypothetical protein
MTFDHRHHAYNRPRKNVSSFGQRVTQAQNATIARRPKKITLPKLDFERKDRPTKQGK